MPKKKSSHGGAREGAGAPRLFKTPAACAVKLDAKDKLKAQRYVKSHGFKSLSDLMREALVYFMDEDVWPDDTRLDN